MQVLSTAQGAVKSECEMHASDHTLRYPQEPLLATVKRRKLAWLWNVTRHDNLSKTVLKGTLEGWQRRGRRRKFSCTDSLLVL